MSEDLSPVTAGSQLLPLVWRSMEGSPEFQPRGGLRDPEQRAGLQHRDLRAKHRVLETGCAAVGSRPAASAGPTGSLLLPFLGVATPPLFG